MRELLRDHFKNIVLVDDDSDDRDLFFEAVSFVSPTAKVEMKQDGEELMEYLTHSAPLPDVIFLDLNMPRKNGKECLLEIMENKDLSKIPVIVYTTSLNPTDIEETFNQGASRFFRKPNSFEELKELLHVLLAANTSPKERTKENYLVNRSLKFV